MSDSDKLDQLLAHVSDIKTGLAVLESKQDTAQNMLEKQNGRVGKSEDDIIVLKERTKDIPEIKKDVSDLKTFKIKVVAYASTVGIIAGGAADYVKHKIGL